MVQCESATSNLKFFAYKVLLRNESVIHINRTANLQ